MKRILITSLIVVTSLILVSSSVAAASIPDKVVSGPPALEKIVFIHYDKSVKPDHPGKPGGGGDPADVYKLSNLILPGPVTYYVDTEDAGVAANTVLTEIIASFDAWNAVIPVKLFRFGGTTDAPSKAVPDNQYSISWGPLNSGIIAETTMWYYPGKPPRSIVEFDIVFNSALPWGIDRDGEGDKDTTTAYDIRNIATHEAGHPVGLDDIYDEQSGMLTMYGYGDIGETQKISLEPGDIKGAQVLYGAP
jgi:hypothetical protein